MLRSVGVLILTCSFAVLSRAQANTCGGLTAVDDNAAKLVYPAIAKAAHVQGFVLILATLGRDGSISATDVVSGPQLLRASAVEFVKHWRVNKYTGPRTCPIAVTYYLNEPGTAASPMVHRSDTQHVSTYSGSLQIQTSLYAKMDNQHYAIHAEPVCLCDPGGTLSRRRRFGIF